jgi:hypothetical protein
MRPTAAGPRSAVNAKVPPGTMRYPNGNCADDGLVLCDAAPYGNCCRTSASCRPADFGGNNHKYNPPYLVTMAYGRFDQAYTPADFPTPTLNAAKQVRSTALDSCPSEDRVRRFLDAFPPAVAGQHGDVRTFRVCCRLVRGFALADSDALPLLREWNARCEPPWSETELLDKLRRARRYGREPVGGLLGGSPMCHT